MKTIEILGAVHKTIRLEPTLANRATYGVSSSVKGVAVQGYVPRRTRKGLYRWAFHRVLTEIYHYGVLRRILEAGIPTAGADEGLAGLIHDGVKRVDRNGYHNHPVTDEQRVALDALQEDRLDVVKAIMDNSLKPWRVIEL